MFQIEFCENMFTCESYSQFHIFCHSHALHWPCTLHCSCICYNMGTKTGHSHVQRG